MFVSTESEVTENHPFTIITHKLWASLKIPHCSLFNILLSLLNIPYCSSITDVHSTCKEPAVVVSQTNAYSIIRFSPPEAPLDSRPQPCQITAIVSKLTTRLEKKKGHRQVLLGWVAPMPKITPSTSLPTHHLGVFESMEIRVVIHWGERRRSGTRGGEEIEMCYLFQRDGRPVLCPHPSWVGGCRWHRTTKLVQSALRWIPTLDALELLAQLQRKKQ